MDKINFSFEQINNDSSLRLINVNNNFDRRFRITFFKESGKFYDTVEFKISPANRINEIEDIYDLVTQVCEYVKNCDMYKDMYAIIDFQDNDCGYPVMIKPEDRN